MIASAEIKAYADEMRRMMDAADSYPELWDRLRRRWAAPHPAPRPPVAELCRAYEEVTGTWVGCD
jgi:hypothetical protein